MNLYEAIFVRKSVRSYTMDGISADQLKRIKDYCDSVNSIFGHINYCVEIVDNRKGQAGLHGLFSVKAPYYLLAYSEDVPYCQMNVGYALQQIVLYLCSQGYGTCFLGSSTVKKDLLTKDGKALMGIVAFGESKGSHIRRPIEAKRLSMDELCVFKEQPRAWMKQLLEAARLSPSSMNSQPWRFVVFDNRIHIFSKKQRSDKLKRWDEMNFGILFSNFMVAAEELWLDVDMIRLENISQKNFPNNRYVLSAILKS